jgi:hypothetical protein
MLFQSSRKTESSRGSKRKVRKLALEAVERREMLSVGNPFAAGVSLHPIAEQQRSTTTAEVAQSSTVGLTFAGAGTLNLDVYESQMAYTQNQAGRAGSSDLVSQGLGVDVSFTGDGTLNLDVNESQLAYTQNQAGRTGGSELVSQGSRVDLAFAGGGFLGLRVNDSQLAHAETGAGRAQSKESASQQSAVDACFEGVGRESLSVGNFQSLFTHASFHHGQKRREDWRDHHRDRFEHRGPERRPIAVPLAAIDMFVTRDLDLADIHRGWNGNMEKPR